MQKYFNAVVVFWGRDLSLGLYYHVGLCFVHQLLMVVTQCCVTVTPFSVSRARWMDSDHVLLHTSQLGFYNLFCI